MAFDKLKRLFEFDDEDDDEQMAYPDQTDQDILADSSDSSTNNVVSMAQAGRGVARKIVIFEPRLYADAKDIATNLLNNQAVIVNFSQLEDSQSRRIVDFLTGTVYALKGEIQRVGDQIFLCTPPKFEIEGSISDTLKNEQGF